MFGILDAPVPKGSYDTKGGVTIFGKIFAYQEKSGSSYKSIMQMPYIQFVGAAIDAPQVDYEGGKEKKKNKAFGTPISELPEDVRNQLR